MHSDPTPDTKWHVPALDGLRGIAATMIVWYHLPKLLALELHNSPSRLVGMLHWSWTAVDLFFAVSGFLITSLLLRARGRPGALRQFWVRRALRIFPLAWFYVGVHAVLAWVIPGFEQLQDPRLLVSMATWTLNFWIAVQGWVFPSVDPLWSLAIEEQFYLLWPLLVLAFPDRGLRRGLLAFIIVSPVLRTGVGLLLPFPATYVLPFSHGDGLALGCLLALELRRPGADARLTLWTGRLLPIALLAMFGLSLLGNRLFDIREDWRLAPWMYTCVALSCACCVAWVVTHSERVPSFLLKGPLIWLGQRSYGIYVWHMLVGLLWMKAWKHWQLPMAWELPRLIVWLFLLIGMAELSWRVIEKPFLSMKDRLAGRQS